MPFSSPSKIKDHLAMVNRECHSLFEQRRFYGWWPVTGKVKVKKKGWSKKKKEKITKLTVSQYPCSLITGWSQVWESFACKTEI